MIWSVKVGDVISVSDCPYLYEIIKITHHDFLESWVVLEDILNHTNRELRLSTILDEGKIHRRNDDM
jgi:hypothetical protein